MNTIRYLFPPIFAASVFMLAGCGGGGSSGSSSGSSSSDGGGSGTQVSDAGISLPKEVSAVSADNDTGANLMGTYNVAALGAETLPNDSDYHKAVTAKYVDEPTLEVFDIIEQVLGAVAQTNYDEQIDRKQVNLNRWVDDGQGGGYSCSYRYTENSQFSLVNDWSDPLCTDGYTPTTGDVLWVYMNGAIYVKNWLISTSRPGPQSSERTTYRSISRTTWSTTSTIKA
jgi:hypothetical protein